MRRAGGRITRRTSAVLASACLLLLVPGVIYLAARATPLPPWANLDAPGAAPASLCLVRDRVGNLLAVRRGSDEAFLPVRGTAVDPILARATLAAEDRRFFLHPGIDPVAVVRAAWQNARADRRISGGSTLTQQLAKLHLDPGGRHRALPAKLRESWWALVLEAHLSKEAILEAYWNRAPYGATVRGIGAAAQLYFGHGPERLSPAEAALLAAIPRSPVKLDPRRDPEAARRARDRILLRLGLDTATRAACLEQSLDLVPFPDRGRTLAPHWLARVESTLPGAASVSLPLDSAIQERANGALRHAIELLGARGADDAAAIVIHNPTGEVRAWVGSPAWSDPGHGQFDATRAPRQPGSALKPFTYALAFEDGVRPATLLPDLPLEYGSGDGSFRPRNYTGEYHGPVRARAALANSWNAAAVALLSGVGPERLRLLLQAAGIGTLRRPGASYGVGLTLGDAEVTLADLTNAYAALARGGAFAPRIELLEARDAAGTLLHGAGPLPDSGAAGPPARRILDPRAAFLVTSILADPAARARSFGFDGPFAFPFPVAIKTGTSSDWRDNWAFGYTREWTVGTWIGRANGAPMDRVSGTAGAILALREIMLALPGAWSGESFTELFPPPAGVGMRTVCALSGETDNASCPEVVADWFETGDPPGAACTWHRPVALDAATGKRARTCTPPERVQTVVFTVPGLPPRGASPVRWNRDSFLAWCADRGWPRPPRETAACTCGAAACRPLGEKPEFAGRHRRGDGLARLEEGAPGRGCRITRPVDGSIYALDPSLPAVQQQLPLEASSGGEPVEWFVDGRSLGRSEPGERRFWPLVPGSHRIRVETSGAGTSGPGDEVRIVVEGPASAPARP